MSNSKSGLKTAKSVREIPLNLLVASPDNVRKSYSRESVEQLAASILAHKLLQNLTVQPQIREGEESGKFEVIAGGRRLSALMFLAERGEIAGDLPIPCNIRADGIAAELSLAENLEREGLDPVDEFEAFRTLHVDKGQSIAEIAARFGVSERLVRERLKLASVSPNLLQLLRAGEMRLDQLMAFTVNEDHARQEEVWEQAGFMRSPQAIREALLEAHIPASDPRVLYVGLEAYLAAGGALVRDLFDEDDGGYLGDAGLLERLAFEKLTAAAGIVQAEGWKWVEPILDYPHGLSRVYARDVPLAADKAQRLEDLEIALGEIEAELEGDDSPEIAARHAALQAEYDALEAESRVFDPVDLARAGAFLTIGDDGQMKVLRGYVRSGEEASPEGPEGDWEGETAPETPQPLTGKDGLSDRLTANLSAHRTLALRDALASAPDMALAALLHVFVASLFYPGAPDSVVQITLRNHALDRFAADAGRTMAGLAVEARHAEWAARLPREESELWAFVIALPASTRMELLAHCVSLSIYTVQERADHDRPGDELALALGLDMTRYWQATANSYFRHVSKSQIIAAVVEGASEEAARKIADLKKPDMAERAEELLQGTGWLPEILKLRTIEVTPEAICEAAE